MATHLYVCMHNMQYAFTYIPVQTNLVHLLYVHTFVTHRCIEAEEESFAFTNSFSTAGEGSVLHLQTVYRHMQHNVRSAAVRAHKKVFPNIPLQLSDHGMVCQAKVIK